MQSKVCEAKGEADVDGGHLAVWSWVGQAHLQRCAGKQMTQTNEVQGKEATFGLKGQREKLVSKRAVLCVQNPSQYHLLSGQDRRTAAEAGLRQAALGGKFMKRPLTLVTLQPSSSGN